MPSIFSKATMGFVTREPDTHMYHYVSHYDLSKAALLLLFCYNIN